MKKSLTNRIEAFLKERRKSDRGGWAEVRREDLDDLQDILDMLIDAKFEKDADGDRAVTYIMIDRTKYEPLHYMAVPYDHKPPTEDQREKAFDMIMFNLSVATERANSAIRLRQHHRDEAKRKEV